MPVPPPIDPRLLAAEIEASVTSSTGWPLAASMHIQVVAVVSEQTLPSAPPRPILAVQVVAPR